MTDSPPSPFKSQTMALVNKRYIENKTNMGLLCFEFILPILVVLVGLSAFILSTKPRGHLYSINDFPIPQRLIINKDCLLPNSTNPTTYFKNINKNNINVEYIDFRGNVSSTKNTLNTIKNYSNIIYKRTWESEHNIYIQYSSYLIVGNPRPNMTTIIIFFNYTNPQSLFLFTNLLHQQIIRQITNKYIYINMKIMQMETNLGSKQVVENQFFTFSAFALSFIPGMVAAYMLKERNSGLKHLQLTSGMSLFIYWSINYIIDVVFMMVPVIILIIIYNAFQLDVIYIYIYIYISNIVT